MKYSTVKKRVILGLAFFFIIMTALSGFAYLRVAQIQNRTLSITTESWPGLYQVSKLDSLWSERYALLCEYFFASVDPVHRQQLDSRVESTKRKLEETFKAYEAINSQGEGRQRLDSLRRAQVEFDRSGAALTVAIRSGKADEGRRLLVEQMEPAYQQLREAIDAELQFNKVNGDDHNRQILEAVGSAKTGIPISLVVGFLLATACGVILLRTIADLTTLVTRVQKSGLQVNTSATEIAATAQEQLSTANEVAATTAEIGATAKEISATSKSLVHTMREVSEVAEKTATLANSGQSGLARMTSTMQQIMQASASITSRLAVLSEKAGNISTVVTTITKVADQTNLLSLNAAIEAEKAGDYGRGFAVVATEIRRLADQTAAATSDIEQTVKEMQSAVTAGVMGMDKFADEVRRGVESVQQVNAELSQIIQQVQTLTPTFEAVSEGVESQAAGAQQISDSLAQLSEASKQTVESLRQSNAAIDQLNDVARGLQNGVTHFVLAA